MGGKQSGIAKHHLQQAQNKQPNQGAAADLASQSEQTMNMDDNTFVNKLGTGGGKSGKNATQSRRKQIQLKPQNVMSKKTAYERIEARLPLQIMDIREYEGRLKKLVYGKETVSLRQITYVFARDYEDWEDLTNNDSALTKIMTSSCFKLEDSENEVEMSIQYLLLFGLLYCQGTPEEKSSCLYDILQDGLQEQISANDKDLKDCFWRLLELASVQIHKWSQEVGDEEVKNVGIEQINMRDSQLEKERWDQVYENIQEKFLDQIFDIHSRIKREEFIQAVVKKANYLFKPAEIRKRIKEEFSKF
eukprot:403344536